MFDAFVRTRLRDFAAGSSCGETTPRFQFYMRRSDIDVRTPSEISTSSCCHGQATFGIAARNAPCAFQSMLTHIRT